MALLSAAAWAGIGAVGSIGLGIYGANQAGDAADAQIGASREANALQAQTRNMAYTANEPQRYTGYQALGDLNSLYGYGTSPYTPLNQLTGATGTGGGGMGGGVINVGARQAGGDDTVFSSNLSALGIGGGGRGYVYGAGEINPATGTVDVKDTSANDPAFDEALTNYLRTGEWSLDERQTKYLTQIKNEIDRLRNQGYAWDAENSRPSGPGWSGAGSTGTQPGQPSMAKFFASPDYNFRRTEGERGIGNSFAARGGAASGNALRALSEFNSNLASGEFGNYFNRLSQMAGMGQVANQQNQQAGQYAAGNMSNGLMAQGDARASGIMSGYGSLLNGFNGAANAMGNYAGRDPYPWLQPLEVTARRI